MILPLVCGFSDSYPGSHFLLSKNTTFRSNSRHRLEGIVQTQLKELGQNFPVDTRCNNIISIPGKRAIYYPAGKVIS